MSHDHLQIYDASVRAWVLLFILALFDVGNWIAQLNALGQNPINYPGRWLLGICLFVAVLSQIAIIHHQTKPNAEGAK